MVSPNSATKSGSTCDCGKPPACEHTHGKVGAVSPAYAVLRSPALCDDCAAITHRFKDLFIHLNRPWDHQLHSRQHRQHGASAWVLQGSALKCAMQAPASTTSLVELICTPRDTLPLGPIAAPHHLLVSSVKGR